MLNLLRARFGEWLEARNYSPRTRPDYDRYVRDFLAWIAENTQLSFVAEVSSPIVLQYQLALYHPQPNEDGTPGRTLSISAQICRLAAIKTFFSWLVQTQQIAHNPALLIESPKQPETLPRDILTQDEARCLLESTPVEKPLDIRDRAILEVLYGTAVRRAELLSNHLRCRLTKRDTSHRTRQRRAHSASSTDGWRVRCAQTVSCRVSFTIRICNQPRGIIHFQQSGAPLSDNDIVRIVRKAAKRAGIESAPHRIRSGIVAPHIYFKSTPTSGRFKSCSATKAIHNGNLHARRNQRFTRSNLAVTRARKSVLHEPRCAVISCRLGSARTVIVATQIKPVRAEAVDALST
jgi:site-specific recombinase XerD